MRAPLRTEVMTTPEVIGESLAAEIAAGIREAAACGRNYVLGCPAGRTPLPVYRALATHLAGMDLSRLHLIMMDEFVRREGDHWRRIQIGTHNSCVGFAMRHILAGLPHLPPIHLHAPDPQAPDDYERLIERLGGIDLFLLAAGASDGHVAFNPPGTPLDSPTRVVRLAEATRQDNLATFPAFRALEEVPTHGVSIGLDAIVKQSRSAVMVLHGAHKAAALSRLQGLTRFDPQWPASVVYACRRPRIVIDATLAAACRPVA